jgi:hypothetical protein
MIFEVIALGLISAIRPATSQAAVVALLRAPRARRTLLAFTLAGFIVSVALGALVVVAFDGAGGLIGRSHFPATFEVIAGIAALAFAAGIERGRLTERIRDRRAASRSNAGSSSRIAQRLREPSALTAGLAGVATHIPGLIFLVAMNAIAAERLGATRSFVQVLTYNALWFAVPVAALVVAIRSPGTADTYLDRATAWARAHEDRLLVAVFGALGLYLIVKGTVALA